MKGKEREKMAGVWPVCHVGRENGGLGESSKIGGSLFLGNGGEIWGRKKMGKGLDQRKFWGKERKMGGKKENKIKNKK